MVTVSHLGKEIYSADPANAKAELPSDIFSPNSGYTVTVSTADSAGATKTQTLGLSVEDDWTLYPRYGVVGGSSDHNASMTNDQLEGYQDGLEQLTQMHINNYFFYDVYDTTGNPFPANTESYNQEWVSWSENKPKIDTGLVKSLVNYIHENGGKAMLYNMINAVSVENGQTETSVPESVVNGAAIYNAKDHSDFGKTGNLAQTSVQRFVDPANPEWQKYIIDTMIKAIKEGNFDGWQADTMGNNVVYKINEDSTKTEFNMSDGYDDLSKAAAEALKELGYSYMINDINTGNAEALSQTGISVPYSEIWPIAGDDQYSDLKELVDRLYSLNNVSPILSVYTEKGMDATGAESLNPDSELLVDAIVAASGGYHMTTAALNSSQNANRFGIIQSEYYPNQNMKTTPALAKSEFNYQQFITAYEELLRGKGLTQLDNHATIQASDGVDLTSTGGEAGKVYTWTKATAERRRQQYAPTGQPERVHPA
ncbi:hypothetical protein BG910_03790 [Neisseria chenwenguii]|uniref:Dextranase n=1 Tax=Neisseria chenwenguii TaxID=1853278 RepID=A0A220S0S4_9NEIS|nr:glycoside hydrolase family 66 protein [Neisseria chenwenguii]ASK26976.1 hypothetical protein BG910_03790 [Neisseria chenwenguii]